MRLLLIAAVAAGALCANAAAAQSQQTGATPDPVSPATAPAPPNDAPGYLMQAGRSDMYELQSSQQELSRGHDPKAKAFAQQMITDHTKSTQMLLAAAHSAGLPAAPPATLDPRRQAMIDQLKAAPTPDFDTMYLHQQMMAHQEALMLHQNFAKNGSVAALRPVAAQISGVVQHHIDMLQSLGAR